MNNSTEELKIDIVDPDEDYSVALFQKQAREVIADIHNRNKIPVLVGGTGLYIRAVIDDYDFSGIGGNQYLRELLFKEAEKNGSGILHKRLSEVDPDAASKLHPKDTRRIIRALEVYYFTGKPISSYQRVRDNIFLYQTIMFGLFMEREKLYRRIEQRVDKMINLGLIEEVRGLLQRGYHKELKSMRGLGYKEISAFLAGESSLEQAVGLLKRNTRRFAKRQLTWFRRDDRIKWFDIEEYGGLKKVAKEITLHMKEYFKVYRKV
ncbi:MAG: tRNA dimethylallyltransferase [Pelotomaculum thermopropionicum]|uniref:tRNA dimethylallyltransferase n=1 Tax=Pelotomaculum thermopropionicum TaxID=110500 RepID=A0A124FYE3_9FIRM|nr:MAG: tRNA dimethylallyltransferase [Pelotomaculum thermopropionicum]